jgi:MFS family permease
VGKHHTLDDTDTDTDAGGPVSRVEVRNIALAMAALTVFVVAMIASYSGAFAKPSLHHLNVAVAGPQQMVDAVRGQNALSVTEVADATAARGQVVDRKTDAAFAVGQTGDLEIYVAGGGGRSVANAAETVGRGIAAKAGLTPTVEDVAPTSSADPQGTVEFYAVIFLSIGATLGASAFGWIAGRVRRPCTLALRSVSLAAYSALLAGVVTLYVDALLGALTGHAWQVFGALWLYAMAVGGAVTGVAAALGTVASVVLTLFLVIVGNAAAAGPVGKPLLTGFYTTFNAIVPQGSGVALLRGIEYFGGNGAAIPLVVLAIWGGAGVLLASMATVAGRLPRRDSAEPGALQPEVDEPLIANHLDGRHRQPAVQH